MICAYPAGKRAYNVCAYTLRHMFNCIVCISGALQNNNISNNKSSIGNVVVVLAMWHTPLIRRSKYDL